MNASSLNFQVTGYQNGDRIPAKFATVAGGGKNVSIGLKWSSIAGAKSYALLFDDIHPVANNWVHWLLLDIPANVTEIPEGASRTSKEARLPKMPAGSRELITSWDRAGYDGPEPPPGSGDHEYVARLYALDVEKLNISENVSRDDFLNAIKNHIVAEATWSGFFER